VLALDPFITVNTQTCLFDERMIWAPHFRRCPYQNISNDLNNLLTLLQPKHLFTTLDVGNLNKVVSSPSTPFIETLPITGKRIIISDGN